MNSRNTFKTLMLTAVLSLVSSWAMAEPYKEKAWEVVRMAHDAQRLYLATAERGLVVIDKATGEQTFFNVENGKLENNGINDVVVIGDKVYLAYRVVFSDRGVIFPKNWLVYFDINEGRVTPFEFTDKDYNKLHHIASLKGWVLPRLFLDDQNNLWFSVQDIYACKYDFAQHGIVYVSPALDVMGSSVSNILSVADFRQDGQGNLYIASGVPYKGADGLLYRLTAETMASGEYQLERLGVGHQVWDTASCMEIDNEGNVWIGVKSVYERTRLYRVTPDGVWHRYPEEGFEPFVYSDIEKDDDGRLWVLTTDALYQVQGEQFVEVACPFETGRRGQLHIDGDVVYMACEKGLYKYQDGGFTQMELPAGGHIGISQPEKPSAASQFFGVDGIQRTSLSKGLNIVRRDGSTGKVVVK